MTQYRKTGRCIVNSLRRPTVPPAVLLRDAPDEHWGEIPHAFLVYLRRVRDAPILQPSVMKEDISIETVLLDAAGPASGNGADAWVMHADAGGAIMYVLAGTAEANDDDCTYRLNAQSLLTLLHGGVIRIEDRSEDFRAFFLSYSNRVVCDADLMAHLRNSAGVISRHPVVPLLNPAHLKLLESYCEVMHQINLRTSLTFRSEIMKNMLEAVLFSIDGIYRDHFPLREPNTFVFKHSRREETTERFYALVASHYMTERSTSFYADRLCITAKHLAATVKSVSGRTPSEIISHAVVMDAKSKLKSTGMTVGEIADSLNFPNPSFFCKYFRKHTGASPRKYRNTVNSSPTTP